MKMDDLRFLHGFLITRFNAVQNVNFQCTDEGLSVRLKLTESALDDLRRAFRDSAQVRHEENQEKKP